MRSAFLESGSGEKPVDKVQDTMDPGPGDEGALPCHESSANTANAYDIESEHAYIMTRALNSYNHYRDKEHRKTRAAKPKNQTNSKAEYGYKYVFQLIPKRVLNVRPPRPTRPRTAVKRPAPKKLDAISEVGRANLVEQSPQRVSSAARIVLPMDKLKAKNYVIRRHPMERTDMYDQGALFAGLGYNYRPHSARSVDSAQGKTHSLPTMSKSSTPRSTDSNSESNNMSRSMHEGGMFSTVRSPRKPYFVIHPEWSSEQLELKIEKLTLHDRTCTYPPRRCKSAPPPRRRNPITWQ